MTRSPRSDDRVRTPHEGQRHAAWDETAQIATPLRLHDAAVPHAWVDYNQHMSESSFLLAFGDNADAFFRYFGIDEQYRSEGGSMFTAETHLRHLLEVSEGEHLAFTLQVLDVDAKRVHLVHEMFRDSDGALVCTAEQLLLHVDTAEGRVSPMPDRLVLRLEAIRDAHRALPVPDYVGHVMGLPKR
jgi:carnitine 3-dehydrogenase